MRGAINCIYFSFNALTADCLLYTSLTMKVLKALLAVFTTLAVALTAALLLWQDKNAPRYIHTVSYTHLMVAISTTVRV